MAAKDGSSFDVVIVGGGHNGLVCAAYLARAGLKVKVLERRHIVGGAVTTEEFHPGFRNSICSYAVGLLAPEIIRDLELARHGLKIIERPMTNFLPLSDGDYLKFYSDGRTKAEVARHSPGDAERLADYGATLERLAEVIRPTLLETPPNAGGGLLELLRAWRTGRRVMNMSLEDQRDLADIMVMSEADFLGRWFEDGPLKTLLCFDGIVGTMASPYSPGTAYVLLHHCFGETNGRRGVWGHAIGGMGAISDSIAASARAAGADIEVEAPVAEVLTEDSRATGVRLEDGRVIKARAVASNVDPKLLFLKLIDPGAVTSGFRRRMENYICRSGTLRINVALSELPDFTCQPGTNAQEHHASGIVLSPTMEYMDQAYIDARRNGWARRPIVEMLIPSTIDSTLAPDGQHVASLFCQHFNPELPDGRSWDDCKEEAADDVFDTICEFAPNFRDAVIARQVLSPLDMEREFGLTGGDIFHGTLDVNQLYSMRPTLGHANYRMPVKGLYMCGSGAHPGGGVTGAPGHNAAREIAGDFRRRRVGK